MKELTPNAIFSKNPRWISYSGETSRHYSRIEGITYFDHPSNPGQPTGWHVRDDGWLCASPCMKNAITTTKEAPLTLRYLLHVHSGAVRQDRADSIHADFAVRKPLSVIKGAQPHTRWQVVRETQVVCPVGIVSLNRVPGGPRMYELRFRI